MKYSSPRRMRENRYAILVQCLEFPTFSTYKRAYRFLFLKCHRQICVNLTTKLRNYYEILTVKRGDPAKISFVGAKAASR